ncbi:PIN domain-containing protein [Neoaquamicrobium sediminum]|uniref:PIN domain-containing protein n=1 Tax=Neoaquamicrobium sediminum TaxID=1849104 RepID=UPI0040362AE9
MQEFENQKRGADLLLIDSAVIVSVLCEEEGSTNLLTSLAQAKDRCTTPLAVFEAAIILSRRHSDDVSFGTSIVEEFLDRAEVAVIDLPAESRSMMAKAYERYGNPKRGGALNMSELITYAVAKLTNARLLSTNQAFARTDIEIAS